MRVENAKDSIAKKKKRTKIMCYISLVVLNILLFMPIICRTFFKEKEVVVKQVGVVISCNKSSESISSTFLNGEPQSILYKINGDYTAVYNPDENNDVTSGVSAATVENNETENNVTVEATPTPSSENTYDTDEPLHEKFRKVSNPTFDENTGTTSFKVNSLDMSRFEGYAQNLNTIENQLKFFEANGFSCTKMEI